jgi:chemotaxis signal transduction protein
VPGAVEGLVNVRGRLLTVADAHALLDRPREQDAASAILLLDLAGRRLGLIVTEVLDFMELPESELAPREDLPGLDPRLVRAVGHWEGRPFVLLDLDLLVGPTLAH